MGICAYSQNAVAQETINAFSTLRIKKIPVTDNPYCIDTGTIVRGSVSVLGVSQDMYEFSLSGNTLFWIKKPIKIDSVWVKYRILPILNRWITARKSFEEIRYNFYNTPQKDTSIRAESLFQFQKNGLKATGSLGRSMAVGNNRDAVLQSNLNLRLNGYIGDSIEMSAVIADDNLPIQPQGNTQHLRDFDRILLQFKKGRNSLSLGDLDLQEKKGTYLQFKKRIQGVRVEHTAIPENQKMTWSSSATGALTKGRYYRQVIQPLDGNQGPYRLRGANNELYLIILSGSERVYMDGELLTRGQDRDYIIDYNTAEISFTPNRMINKDRRIQVEFEYAERNYLSSVLYVHQEFTRLDNINFGLSYYRSSDAKNSQIDQPLSLQEKQLLTEVGDSIQLAYVYNAIRDSFSVGKLLYRKIDTVYNNLHDSVFVLSTQVSPELYAVQFTYVGPGKGDYMPLTNTANGKVFKWVSPDAANRPTGQWAPIRLLTTPKKQEVLALQTALSIMPHLQFQSELAMSKNDINTFSLKDKSNDLGFAGKWGLNYDREKLQTSWLRRMKVSGTYEQISSSFQSVERIRSIEFYRDWSVQPESYTTGTEQLANFHTHLEGQKGGVLSYQSDYFKRSTHLKAWRHTLAQQIIWKGFTANYQLQYTQLSKTKQSGYFFRPKAELTRSFGKTKKYLAGVSYFSDQQAIRVAGKDTLVPESFYFKEYKGYVQSSLGETGKWNLSYFGRENKIPGGVSFLKLDRSENYSAQVEWQDPSLYQFRFTSTYRVLHDFRKDTKDRNLSGRLELNANAWSRALETHFLYESSGGQEQLREYSYVAVPAGQGQYQWIDYNQNGLEELNEFELAVFQDQKKYIRIFTPVNQFRKCVQSNLNFSLQIDPSMVLATTQSWYYRLLRKVAVASYVQFQQKLAQSKSLIANPFQNIQDDTSLVALQSFVSHTLFINKNSTRWIAESTIDRMGQKSLMLYGYEEAQTDRFRQQLQINWNQRWSSQFQMSWSRHTLNTDNALFLNRNYDVKKWKLSPSLTYLLNRTVRATLTWQYSKSANTLLADEEGRARVWMFDVRTATPAGGSLQFKYAWHQVQFASQALQSRTPSGFLILEGLEPGRNQTWMLDYTQRLPGNIELSTQYEGRKIIQSPVVHTGRLAIRALF